MLVMSRKKNLPTTEILSSLTFRCPLEWKRIVHSMTYREGKTIQKMCLEAISTYFGIGVPEIPKEEK
jgi:hypothetical protein